MAAYRKDQGRMARMAVFWSAVILIFYGCTSLHQELKARVPALARPIFPEMPSIAVLAIDLNGAFLISLVIFAGAIVLLRRWVERPKNADLLIETEQELRKVTWPTLPEVVNSSVIVIVCVLFLMAFLAGADWFLAQLTRYVLFG